MKGKFPVPLSHGPSDFRTGRRVRVARWLGNPFVYLPRILDLFTHLQTTYAFNSITLRYQSLFETVSSRFTIIAVVTNKK